jgi:hypothetical protein
MNVVIDLPFLASGSAHQPRKSLLTGEADVYVACKTDSERTYHSVFGDKDGNGDIGLCAYVSSETSMPMLMMHVGQVWVRVFDLRVLMPMCMRLARGVFRPMFVPMILVMDVRMRM